VHDQVELFRADHQIQKLAITLSPGDGLATQCVQRRIVRLQHGDLGHVRAVDDAARDPLSQVIGEGLDLG
jgi:hypothetical protein